MSPVSRNCGEWPANEHDGHGNVFLWRVQDVTNCSPDPLSASICGWVLGSYSRSFAFPIRVHSRFVFCGVESPCIKA